MTRRVWIGLLAVMAFASAVVATPPANAATPIEVVAVASSPDGEGYLIVESDGVVWAYGNVAHRGDLRDVGLNQPIVAMAVTPSGGGYWLVAADGGVFAFGDAGYFGSAGAIALNQPIVGIAATPTGLGYWLAARDGGIFAFGDAAFFGSTGAITLNQPIVAMAARPGGDGYWLVASDGGVFAFGAAPFLGSMGAVALNRPVMTIAATPTGVGYRLLAEDGGEFDFGDANFIGSIAARGVTFAAGATRPQGDGHWLVTRGGQLQQSGLAARFGAPTPGPPAADPPPLGATDLDWESFGFFDDPMAVRARTGDPGHLYVAERAGRIVRVAIADGSRTTLIDLSALTDTGSERGLLGFDFSPDGSKIYLNHTDLSDNVELVEYDLSVGPPARRFLLEIAQPFGNHNGGDIHVTSDGMIWASSGDGGSGGDPFNNAQNRANLLGTIYRIHPTPSGGLPYTIPTDNPFFGEAGVRQEIWSYGLRNPWRFSIDRVTGDLWIGDVGQNRQEEINREPAGAAGTNHGWKRFEGDLFFADVIAPGAAGPIHTYNHGPGCSVTGGVVYRGPISDLDGAYLFGDFCSGTIWGLRQSGATVTEVEPLGVNATQVVQFGTDLNGDLYVVRLNGEIRKLVPGS